MHETLDPSAYRLRLCCDALQVHDNAGGIGHALGSLAGKAVAAAQGTTAAVSHKASALKSSAMLLHA